MKMKWTVSIPFLVVFSVLSVTQWRSVQRANPAPTVKTTAGAEDYCAMEAVLTKSLAENPTLAKQHDFLEEQVYRFMQNEEERQLLQSRADYTVPVVVHITHQNGVENISDAAVIQGIQNLNDAFENVGYYDPAIGVDTKIEFCLARQDPDGNATNGITRTVDALTNLTNYNTQDITLKDLSRWDPRRYVNIWLVKEICGNNGCGVAGYAYFPASHGNGNDGIVMEAQYFAQSQGSSGVTIHEMGHYLGVYHTFQGGCPNNDCLNDGDRVCDTPPDQSTATVPCNGTANSCNTDVNPGDPNNPFTVDQNDMFWNYMDYGNFNCYRAFTQGQSDRMNFFLTGTRKSLLDSKGCSDPCLSSLTANFTVSTSTTVNAGTLVNFTNTSINATNYQWLIDGVPFAASLNSSYTFNTIGTFEIELIAENADPNCRESFSVTITVVCPADAFFSISTNFAQPGQTISLTNGSTNATIYNWTANGTFFSSAFEPSYTFGGPGLFNICLTAGDGFCEDTHCDQVIVSAPNTGCADTFLKTFGNLNTPENLFCVVNLPNGNLILGGSFEGEGMLMEMTTNGLILWQKQIFLTGSNNEIRRIILSSDNHIIGVGFNFFGNTSAREAYVFKYNYQSHVVVWNSVMTIPEQNRYDAVIENDAGNYVVVGQSTLLSSGNCDASWQVFDRNTGAVLSERMYDLGSCEQMADIIQHNGQYYTTGRYNNSGGSNNRMRPAITVLDNNGDHIWTKLYLVNANNQNARLYSTKILMENNQLIVTGRGDLNGTSGTDIELFIFTTDLSGNLFWAKAFNIVGGNSEQPNRLISIPTGFILSGNYTVGGQTQGFLINFDKIGNVLWAKSFDTGGENWSHDLTFQGGNFFLIGSASENGGNQNDFLIGKLDINGEIADGCFVDLQLNQVNIPNPYEGDFQITRNNPSYNIASNNPPVGDFDLEENIICLKVCNEICDNGLDDDDDGYVDCYDTDCNCLVDGCSATLLEENFSSRLAWQSTVDKVAINSTPIVGNLNPNEDDIPEIIVCETGASVNQNSGNEVMIFTGDGSNAAAPRSLVIPGNFDGHPVSHPSIGDINADGIPELVMVSGDRRLRVYTNYKSTGLPVMESMVVSPDLVGDRNMKGLLADFDQDGISEIYVGNDVYQFDFSTATPTLEKVLDGNGSEGLFRWNDYWQKGCNPIAIDLLDPSDCGGDPDCLGLEIAAGNMIYSIDLSNIDGDGPQIKVQRNLNSYPINLTHSDGYTSVADIDLDGTLDILVSGTQANNNGVYVWNKNNYIGFFPSTSAVNPNFFGGSVTVADVFDDRTLGYPIDLPEILVTSSYRLNCYNLSALLATPATPYWWTLSTTDISGATGLTVFDFNGDGIKEMVYRDQDYLRIMYGGNAPFPSNVDAQRNYSRFIAGSRTTDELPIVADVDNDGEAEIAVTSYTFAGVNNPASDYRGRLRVFESDPTNGGPWMSARQVWNQHNYFVMNVNDDLTIPPVQQLHHLEFPGPGSNLRPYNSFLTQVSILNTDYQPFLAVADIYPVIDTAICAIDSFSLTVTICNQGDADMVAHAPMSFYDANPTTGTANLIFSDNIGKIIEVDSCEICNIKIPAISGNFFLVVNDNHSIPPPFSLADDFPSTDIPECDYTNNLDSFELDFFPLPPLDLGPDTAVCANGIFHLDAGPGYESYLWQDGSTEQSYTAFEPGTYWVQVTGGCDNQSLSDTITIGIIPNTEVELPEDLIICEGDTVLLAVDGFSSVQWYPNPAIDCPTCDSVMVNPTDSLVVTVVVTSLAGCYSSDSINIMVEPASSAYDTVTICDGDTIQLYGSPVWQPGNYTFTTNAATGCDSTHYTTVLTDPFYLFEDSINICEGDTVIVFGQSVWQNETVVNNLSTINGCDSTYQTTIFVNENIESSDSMSICPGDTIILFGTPQWQEGIYFENNTAANGCDSTHYTTVLINTNYLFEDSISICEGDTAIVFGQSVWQNEIVLNSLSTINGCDSTYQTTVLVNENIESSDTLTICQGDTIIIFGNPQWQEGIYSENNTAANGCDSTAIIQLLIDTLLVDYQQATLCAGDTLFHNGMVITTAGYFENLIPQAITCDSLYQIDVTINQPVAAWETFELCPGDTILLFGNPVWQAGVYDSTFNNASLQGCDSTFTATVNLLPEYLFTDSISICDGDTAIVFGQPVWQNETIVNNLSTINGCDSIFQTTVFVTENIESSDSLTICQGDTTIIFGIPQWQEGIYVENNTAANGCDSTVTINLFVDTLLVDYQQATLCAGDTLFHNGMVITTAGYFENLIPQAITCDSLYQIDVTINQPVAAWETFELCPGDTILLFGNPVWQAGVYDSTFNNASLLGCDSTFTATVNLLPEYLFTDSISICDGDTAIVFGQPVWQNETVVNNLSTINGCDSIFQTTVLVNENVQTNDNIGICEGDTIILFGNPQWQTGTYFENYAAANGCDSTATINLFVDTIIVDYQQAAICDGDTLFINGMVITTAGLFENQVSQNIGCDSLYQVEVDLAFPVSEFEIFELCPGDTIQLFGNPVWQPGIYDSTFNNASSLGCDSTFSATVVTFPEYTFMDTISICDGDTALVFGSIPIWYSETLISQFATIDGCDSTYHATVIVNENIETYDTINICQGDTAIIFGNPEWLDGIYIINEQAITGCDSLVYINLDVDPYLVNSQNATLCVGDTLFAIGLEITSAGNYENIVPQTATCDSLYQLQVSMENSVFYSENIMICPGDTIILFGNPVWSAGIYDSVFTSQINGCDSTHQIVVAENQQIEQNFSQTICAGEAFFWLGDSLYTAGTYTTGIPGFGSDCDTLITLELIENPLPLASWEANSSCLGETNGQILIDPQGLSNNLIYEWEDPNLQGDLLENLSPGMYPMTVTDDNGCSNIYEIDIAPIATPTILLPEIMELEFGENGIINSTVNSSEPVTYFWSPAEGLSCTDCPNPMVTGLSDEIYFLTVITEEGCMATDTIQLRINNEYEVFIPNAVSPNNDGINDGFTVFGSRGLHSITLLRIFDRWGELIAEYGPMAPNDPTLGWDGKFNGQLMNPGVFVYTVELLFVDGKVKHHAGDLTLIQ